MANLTYRQSIQETPSSTTTKNATLTSQEIDGNFKSLNDELITKAALVSPGFSGVPTAPTATAGTNTTQLATTAFVQTGLSGRQPLDAELTAISGLSANGLITRTGASTAASRSIAVSGTGLSVTNADGVAGNPTVTSNATAANTASTIVARNASGNFSAGTITATLSGTATQVSNTLTRGTYLTGNNFNGSAATTWAVDATSANTASKVVARDANGDFVARIVTVTDLNSTSDASLKDNVQVVDGLAKLEQVNPVEFIWKQSGNKSYGVIAQELEKIMPELVAEQDNGIKNVSYIPLIALLIDAVKKLDARVKELETDK